VYAEPANLDVRVVLADLLQQAGDPRGEFIALQLAIGRDPDGNLVDESVRKRAAALLAAHVDRWTAGLPGVVRGSVRFANGFLAAFRTWATARELEDSFASPLWSTVEELAIESQPDLGTLLQGLPLLRALHVDQPSTLTDLAKLGPYPNLRVLSAQRPGDWLVHDRDAFPNLEVVGRYHYASWYSDGTTSDRELLAQARKLRLRALVVKTYERQLEALLAARAHGPELRLVMLSASTQLERLEHLHPGGWWVRLPSGATRADIAWGGGPVRFSGNIVEILTALAAGGIEDVSIYAPGPDRPYIRERLRWGAPVRWEVSGFDLFE
jgi:uncharacterized protein (TIGR02996 family)